MNHIFAITGSQSGMGLAFRANLERLGHQVIGIDLPGKGAEVTADLSTKDGRNAAVAGVLALCQKPLDGVIANAGIDSEDSRFVFAINYEGVIDVLNGLRPSLAANSGARVLITSSNSMFITPGIPEQAVDHLLCGSLEEAIQIVGSKSNVCYQVSKLALVRWMRARAVEWAKEGITMNAIAPGAVRTPLLERDLIDPVKGPVIRALPKPLGEFPAANDIAGLAAFLLSEQARFIVGQVVTIDGGIEVSWREKDFPSTWQISESDWMNRMKL
ncbi:MAG TPA: NAD-dependent epimerase [Cytophagales bacterium]|nr:NAD-dependent epimerase [Cytophagales bacterium]